MKVLGIDPGLTGALAVVSNGGKVQVWDIPTMEIIRGKSKKKILDCHNLNNILRYLRLEDVAVAYLEEVHSMPRQGVVSMFAFGGVYWALRMALVCNDFELNHVTPQAWKKSMSVRQGKDTARLRASELFPGYIDQWSKKMHHNRAEAVLIAAYGLKTLQEPRTSPLGVAKRRRLGKPLPRPCRPL